jgi:rhamnosyltransferase subunit B
VNVLLIGFGSEGDVQPLLGLGTTLKRRGHHVTVIASGYFEERIRSAGLESIPIGSSQEYLEFIDHPDLWHPRRAPKFLAEHAVIPAIEPLYEILSRIDSSNTVMLASFIAIGARLANEKLGIPLATYYVQPSYWRSLTAPPIVANLPIPSWSPGFVHRLVYWGADRLMDDLFLPGIQAARTKIGLPKISGHCYDWMDSPQRIMGFFPEWFSPPQADWLPQIRLTGFLKEFNDENASVPDFGSPPILFTAGTAMGQVEEGKQFFQESAEACRILGRRGLLLTRFPKQVPDKLPDGVRHVDYLPFDSVLPHMAAIVHHGGIGTLAAGMGAGIPHLIVPRAHDQPDNAARVQRLGIGSSLAASAYRGQAVAATLERLLNSDAIRSSCATVRWKMRAGRPLDLACDLLEDLLRKTP